MRTGLLISRISRLVETAGAFGDGSTLAEEYASAVNVANSRLEAVVAAADAKSISDAIRLLSEDPPLLEEVSALDFFQLSDWESLCDMNGWRTPPKIDKQLMERAVEIGDAQGAIEPFLAMYKKAVRVNNVRLAVKSLRRLVDLDHSQDWSRNLKQSEKQLQALIVEEFLKAQKDGQDEACDRLAQELLDGVWIDGIAAKGAEDVRRYRTKRESEKRDADGRENITILEKCLNEKWDRKLAFSLVQAIDGFVEKGWIIPEKDRGVVDACRMRCAKEFEQEEAEKRWREVNEKLHAAIQKEDCEAIREALSAPEFLDRDPMEEMLCQAQGILDHAEAARKRKTYQMVAIAFLAILSVLGVSGWWLKQKLIARRCEGEAEKLAYLERQAREKPKYAIEGIAASLAKLKDDDPEVYGNPKINQFETRLKALVAENSGRTNQITGVLVELEQMNSQAWSNVVEYASVTSRLGRVESLLVKDDDDYRTRFFAVKNSWIEYVERREKENHDRATKFQATLVSHLRTITERLGKELARASLKKEVANCQASLEEWKSVHSKYAEELSGELAETEKAFNDAVEEQRVYVKSLEKLTAANDAIGVLEGRNELIEFHGNYPEIKHLRPLEVGAIDVKDVLSPQSAAIKAYLDSLRGGISQDEFDNFIKEDVAIIADSPEYYSLYGLTGKNDSSGKIVAVAKGKPDLEKPSYETSWKISCDSGELLSFYKKSVVKELKSKDGATAFLMPSSDEMKSVVEIANRNNLSISMFENELLKRIDGHLQKAHENGYVADEEKFAKMSNPIRGWMSPYRRAQFVAWYMRWLKEDLKVMPNDGQLVRWYNELDQLANDVQVDGVDESLAWICVWDDRVKRRMVDCAKLLNRMPVDWVDKYRALKKSGRELSAISGWKVEYAGVVKFDPLDPVFEKDPERVSVSAPNVATDHPLYVLRKIEGRLVLVRAFEPGKKSPWRKCAEIERTKEGYLLGEPLYHVFSGGKYIDVNEELAAIAKRAGVSENDSRLKKIPLFYNGGK